MPKVSCQSLVESKHSILHDIVVAKIVVSLAPIMMFRRSGAVFESLPYTSEARILVPQVVEPGGVLVGKVVVGRVSVGAWIFNMC